MYWTKQTKSDQPAQVFLQLIPTCDLDYGWSFWDLHMQYSPCWPMKSSPCCLCPGHCHQHSRNTYLWQVCSGRLTGIIVNCWIDEEFRMIIPRMNKRKQKDYTETYLIAFSASSRTKYLFRWAERFVSPAFVNQPAVAIAVGSTTKRNWFALVQGDSIKNRN